MTTKRRSSEEMMSLIVGFAKHQSEITMIGMEGSRNNENVVRDHFQDYDVTYFVQSTEDIERLSKTDWETYFGPTIVTQTLSENFLGTSNPVYTHMMLLTDENRIDLKILLRSDLGAYLASDRLNTIIWGGEGRVTSDITHRIQAPTEQELADCVTEFYWVSTYVVKGLMRGQVLYAATHLELIREELFKLMTWYYFIDENPGKCDWRLQVKMPDIVSRFYSLSSADAIWSTLIDMEETFESYMERLHLPRPQFVEHTKNYIHQYYQLRSK
jgi:aminoglycoside 6-adenylyltransferase